MKDDDHWKGFAIREVRYRLNLADGLTRRFRPTRFAAILASELRLNASSVSPL